MPFLTPDQQQAAHAWLHDVFVWGGLLSTPKRKTKMPRLLMYGRLVLTSLDPDWLGTTAAQTICTFVKARPIDYKSFVDVDKALEKLATLLFYPDLSIISFNKTKVRITKKPAPMLAKYIANFFANELKIPFDDSTITTYEMAELKKTVIGKALFAFGCFASQQGAKISKAQKAPSNQTSQPGQPKAAPANGYKSSGPQSQNIINIVGQAGQKHVAKGPTSYCIEADKIGKNTPNAFIKPLDSKHNKNGVAEVFFGSGNGYTDCRCWLDDENDAKAFLVAVQNKFSSKYTNIHISKAKSDPNGYFLVKSEFGDVAIKASKLNEALKEEATPKKRTPAIELDESNIEAYTDAFYKYE